MGFFLHSVFLSTVFLCGFSPQAFQQLAGVNTVMYYSAKIISMAGITDDTQAIW